MGEATKANALLPPAKQGRMTKEQIKSITMVIVGRRGLRVRAPEDFQIY